MTEEVILVPGGCVHYRTVGSKDPFPPMGRVICRIEGADMKAKVGEKVKWSSQAHGSWKEKEGTVVALVPEHGLLQSKYGGLPTPKGAVHASGSDRYVVRFERARTPKLYVPLASVVDGKSSVKAKA